MTRKGLTLGFVRLPVPHWTVCQTAVNVSSIRNMGIVAGSIKKKVNASRSLIREDVTTH